MKPLFASFSILCSAIILLTVTAISGTAQPRPTPTPLGYPRDFLDALEEINEVLNTKFWPGHFGSPSTIAFVANYSFDTDDGTTRSDCRDYRSEMQNPYATVEIEIVDYEGDRRAVSLLWVYESSRVVHCDTIVITATPTQTYTPSKTPTSTLTPSLTPTIDFTKTTPTPTSTATSTPQPTS